MCCAHTVASSVASVCVFVSCHSGSGDSQWVNISFTSLIGFTNRLHAKTTVYPSYVVAFGSQKLLPVRDDLAVWIAKPATKAWGSGPLLAEQLSSLYRSASCKGFRPAIKVSANGFGDYCSFTGKSHSLFLLSKNSEKLQSSISKLYCGWLKFCIIQQGITFLPHPVK